MTGRVGEVFRVFLMLGLSAFGGPVAHLSYFHSEFVRRRAWLNEAQYAELISLCQFLPGPASSQVGIALGLHRAGAWGAVAAWLGFTLPSALALTGLALCLPAVQATTANDANWTAAFTGLRQGLSSVAVAVVALAIWNMGKTLCTDRLRISLAVGAACAALLAPSSATQMVQMIIIASAGVIGRYAVVNTPLAPAHTLPSRLSRRTGATLLITWVFLLCVPWLLMSAPHNGTLGIAENPQVPTTLTALAPDLLAAFYRSGSLVFGGGHVVLPLLHAQVVPNGWVDDATFLAGYGAAQAVPGPLFTFAAFLGTATTHSVWGGLSCLLAIFLPAALLVLGALPFWGFVNQHPRIRAAVCGVNASVVGLLIAAFYTPIWQHAIHRHSDFALSLLAFSALNFWQLAPWKVVIGGAILGTALQFISI